MEKTQEFSLADFKKNLKPGTALIGIDYGAVRIGVAVSDTRRVLASPLKIIHKLAELDDIVCSRNIGGFVIGMPFQPDGSEGKTAHQVRLFANRLVEKYALPVLFVDERHSSVDATDRLQTDLGLNTKKIKQNLDAVVAAFLLQSVLDQLEK